MRAIIAAMGRSHRKTAGFFNPIHPWTTQVLGEAGSHYLATLAPPDQAALARKLSARGMAALIVARGAALPQAAAWAAAGFEPQRRDRPAHEIVHTLRRDLAAGEARQQVVHGVLLEVHGVGVLIEGAAASGKSTLALDLVSRGHALVADDAIELTRSGPGLVLGRCPPVLRGFLEVRGLGIVDIRRMHGARAVRDQARLDLVVKLAQGRRPLRASERLAGRRSTRRLLGEPVPLLTLAAPARSPAAGHNLAALVEAACLDRRLRLDGIEADATLARRQARAIRSRQ
jgi:HPr kinase/phosphorylase